MALLPTRLPRAHRNVVGLGNRLVIVLRDLRRMARLPSPGRRRGKQPKGDGTIRHATPYLLVTLIAIAIAIALVFATPAKAHHTPHPIPGKGDQSWQWKWWVWLPEKWQRVGACETGYGKRPGNWKHSNSRYVSAFGIYRPQYDKDAASMGAPPWNDRNPPSPWHQYRAALGHYKMFGGFSGWGCRNA